MELCVVCNELIQENSAKCESCGLTFFELTQIADKALVVCERLAKGDLYRATTEALKAALWE